MSIIESPADSPATQAIYERTRADEGSVPDYTRVMAVNPEAHDAWEALVRAIAKPLGARRWELITLAAAAGIRSRHCRLAHGAKSLPILGADHLREVALDYHHAGLIDAEVAMMDFAYRMSTDSSSMDDGDARVLREAGFTDREIVDIALAAAARNYFSRAIQALGVVVEFPNVLDEELRDALLEGL